MPAVKLLDRVREQLRLKHYSYRTEETYLHWIKRYTLRVFHQKRHPGEMGDEEIRAFLSHLAEKEQVAASTQNQAFSALLFLYRQVLNKDLTVSYQSIGASRPKHLPTVLTKEETQKVIDYLSSEYQLVAKLLYGSGLRVTECLRLRVKDIDFDYKTVTIYDGKGEKDRVTVLPEMLLPLLKIQLDRVQRIYETDQKAQLPGVSMPSPALARKYPNASREWPWQYIFPASSYSNEPRTGEKFRHHIHPSNIQKAVRQAARRAGVNKPVSPHTFRHCFATHLLQNGYDTRTCGLGRCSHRAGITWPQRCPHYNDIHPRAPARRVGSEESPRPLNPHSTYQLPLLISSVSGLRSPISALQHPAVSEL